MSPSIDLIHKPFLLTHTVSSGFQASRQVEHVRWTDRRLKDYHQKRGRFRSLRRNGIHVLETPLVEWRVLWIDLSSQSLVTQTNGMSL